jgi:hypothetical protein
MSSHGHPTMRGEAERRLRQKHSAIGAQAKKSNRLLTDVESWVDCAPGMRS